MDEPAYSPRRTRRPWVPVAALITIAVCLLAVPVRPEWDSKQLYIGLNNVLGWFRHGGELPDAKQFAIFQYLTGLPVALAGGIDAAPVAYRLWEMVSFAGFVGTSWLLWRAGRKYASDSVAWLLVVVMLTGLAMAYATSTFNESAAMWVTAAFAAAVAGRAGAVPSAALFVAAGLTKEVAPPLLVPLWLAGLWIRRDELRRADVARHFVAMAIAFALTIAVHAAFNLIRYGTAVNQYYLSDAFLIGRWDHRTEQMVGLWLSPNGGVVPFWPSIVALVGVATFVAVVRGERTRLTWRGLVPTAMVVATLGGFTAGLSGYFSPYGWWCWGPRFYLPWLPAALLILVRAYPSSFRGAANVLLHRRGAFEATLLFAVLTALPHVFMVFARPQSVRDFHVPDMQFPRSAPAQETELHYMRQVYLAWVKWPPFLATPLIHTPPTRGLAIATVYLAAVVALLWRARQEVIDECPPDKRCPV